MDGKAKNWRAIGDNDRPEPEVHFDGSLPRNEILMQAAKSAQRHVCQSIKGKKRARCGPMPERGTPEQMLEGYWKAPQCTAQKRDGTRCRAVVVRGSDRCVKHGGIQRNPSCPAAGRWYLQGKLRPNYKKYRTHPSALAAKQRSDG